MKNRIPVSRTLTHLTVASLLLCHVHAASAAPRPNIIVIMSDDMGYSDVGCYGGEIPTPNLDRLAAGGLRYTQFYNTGRCVPTRAALLTGLYPHQAGLGRMTSDDELPGYRGTLGRNTATLAEVLRGAGYHTYMSGKWHVTGQLRPDGDKSSWPLQRGFDKFYGTIIGAGSFFDPWTLTRGNDAVTPDNDPEYQPGIFYYTHAISHHAVRFVNEHAAEHPEEPFFLYVSHTAPHWPMHALEEDIARHRGRFDEGYETLRAARFERMRALGVIPRETALSPEPNPWEDVPDELREWELRCMEVYAAMIDSMDRGIGQLVQALEEHDLLDNTLILYLHDNGGCDEAFGREPRKNAVTGVEPMDPDELQTAMFPTRTRDGHPVLMGPEVMPGPATSYIAYGRGWANVSNTPLRQYKASQHEGGIATPLIAHWPQGIPSKGGLRHEPGHLIDLMPTFVDLSDAQYPQEIEGLPVPPMEGRSLVPGFGADRAGEDRVLIWEHYGNAAIRRGRWKLVRLANRPWELYDLGTDRSEMNNLVTRHPEKAAELEQLWHEHAERTLVLPMP